MTGVSASHNWASANQEIRLRWNRLLAKPKALLHYLTRQNGSTWAHQSAILFPFRVFTAVWARLIVFLCPSLVFLFVFTHLGTFEACFVPVLCLPLSLGTFDGVFVPKFSFSVRILSVWARLRPDLFPFRVFTAVWARLIVFLCPSLVFLFGFSQFGHVWGLICSRFGIPAISFE